MSTLVFYLPVLILFSIFSIYAERKIAAFIQDRLGPMETGYQGLLQTTADILKHLKKEVIIPKAANQVVFLLVPMFLFTLVFVGFSMFPVTSTWLGAPTSMGLLYVLAIISFKSIGIIMAGWAAHNKYAFLGAIRSAAQIISYEIPLGLSVLCVVVIAQSLDLQTISCQQGIGYNGAGVSPEQSVYLLGIKTLGIDVTHWGGIFFWHIFKVPCLFFAYAIFFIASLVACNKAPFDLSEAESEIVSGYHTEYTGFFWALLMLSDYAMMLLVSMLGVILFLGSWHTPLPNVSGLLLGTWTSGTPGTLSGQLWSVFWLLGKSMLIVFLQMWMRWTYPRLRVDQLLRFSWQYLTPTALVLLLLTALWKIFIMK